jgi:hypothetical protein
VAVTALGARVAGLAIGVGKSIAADRSVRSLVDRSSPQRSRGADRAGDRDLRIDGKAEKHPLETGTVKRTAQWVGPQLRVVYEVGHAGLLTYTYALVPSTGQLLIRVNFERLPGYPGPFDVKLVYNRSKAL